MGIGPACATCRAKSRRCDRARPSCRRCIAKGLECGGYPEKFRFCGLASRGKWKDRDAPTPDDDAVATPPAKRAKRRQSAPSGSLADLGRDTQREENLEAEADVDGTFSMSSPHHDETPMEKDHSSSEPRKDSVDQLKVHKANTESPSQGSWREISRPQPQSDSSIYTPRTATGVGSVSEHTTNTPITTPINDVLIRDQTEMLLNHCKSARVW